MSRFDFTGFRNELRQDRALKMFDIENEANYKNVERARAVIQSDDTRQLTGLAIADADADILCLQEIDNIDALHAFEYGYLFKMVGSGYRHKYLVEGNDSRGIDVAVMMRDETRDGQKIEFVSMESHAHSTYGEFGLLTPKLAEKYNDNDRVFKRDCLEINVKIGGRPLSIFVVHFKSMGRARDGVDGRTRTMPVREAEARAVRHIIERRFGEGKTASKRFVICGDMNDYTERMVITGDRRNGFHFDYVAEQESAVNVFLRDGFAVNPIDRRPKEDRWTLYHSRGPDERHLCQLDYILLSPALAKVNSNSVPEIVRSGQPWRTLFPQAQYVDRYPRTGWDRPKASDHCPVAIELDLI